MTLARTIPGRSAICGLAVAGAAAAVLWAPSTALAVQCGLKQAPPGPYGVSYGSINVPSAPGTYNAYYSFWSAYISYYARRTAPTARTPTKCSTPMAASTISLTASMWSGGHR